jgi:hypothetical protein
VCVYDDGACPGTRVLQASSLAQTMYEYMYVRAAASDG